MRKARNSMVNGMKDMSYTIKSLGKVHPVRTIDTLASMSVDAINDLDPSEVSDIIQRKIKKDKHVKVLGTERVTAVNDLFRDKSIMSKKSAQSKGRAIMEATRKARPGKKKLMDAQVDRLIQMTTDENNLLERYKLPEPFHGRIIRRNVTGGRKTRRKRRKKGSRVRVMKKKK